MSKQLCRWVKFYLVNKGNCSLTEDLDALSPSILVEETASAQELIANLQATLEMVSGHYQ